MIEIKMPDLGQITDELTIVCWLKEEGEAVKSGEPLFEVETDKATTEVESFADGIIRKIIHEAGSVVRAGEVIALLVASGESLPDTDMVPSSKLQLSPRAKRQAEEVRGNIVPLTKVQQVTAQRMLQSKTSIPHFYMSVEVDLEAVATHRAALNSRQDVKVSYTSYFIKAAAIALKEHPRLNSSLHENNHLEIHNDVNIGVAVNTETGVLVPVMKSSDQKSVVDIALELSGLIERARTTSLSQSELIGGTFTLSNAGMYEVLSFGAVINPPEVAIMAVGSIVERLVVASEGIIARRTCIITLSVDHRAVDGAAAAGFLQSVKRELENPASWQ